MVILGYDEKDPDPMDGPTERLAWESLLLPVVFG